MQDLAVVPLLALMPILADVGPLSGEVPVMEQVIIVVVAVAAVIVARRFLVPRVLDLLARQRNREAFFLVAMAAVFGSAWAMDYAGMSMALGAFLMGVALCPGRVTTFRFRPASSPTRGFS